MMKTNRIILIVCLVGLLMPATAQINTTNHLQQNTQNVVGDFKNVNSMNTNETKVNTSTPMSSRLSTGTYLPADAYTMESAASPAGPRRAAGIPDPGPSDRPTVPLSDATWFLILLAAGYLAFHTLRHRKLA